jgi:hypothetical protein
LSLNAAFAIHKPRHDRKIYHGGCYFCKIGSTECLPVDPLSFSRTNSSQRTICNSQKASRNTWEELITLSGVQTGCNLHTECRSKDRRVAVCALVSDAQPVFTSVTGTRRLFPAIREVLDSCDRDLLSQLKNFVVFLSPSRKYLNISTNILLLFLTPRLSNLLITVKSHSKLHSIKSTKRCSLSISPLTTWIKPCLFCSVLLYSMLVSTASFAEKVKVWELHSKKNGVFWDFTQCGSCKNGRFGGT